MVEVKKSLLFRLVCCFVLITFCWSFIFGQNLVYAQSLLNLPGPGTMITTSVAYSPTVVAGMTLYPGNPLKFDFIIDSGDANLEGEALRQESAKLINYFMATLTVPEDEMWVNLSPYEKDRIIADGLGVTAMGRDMLAQDYMLKQLTASLMYPEEGLGSTFWKKVYAKTQARFGHINIPTNTFNKIWIMPERAIVYVNGNHVFVSESHLKVLLEEDYLAIESNRNSNKHGVGDVALNQQDDMTAETKEIIRKVLIPVIEEEVNTGKNFANLRQIYHSMILASWYKKNLQQSILGKVYMDKNLTQGIDIEDKQIKEKIYAQYVTAFEKGVYDYIKEDYDPATQELIPRKYFSGGLKGIDSAMVSTMRGNPSEILTNGKGFVVEVEQDLALRTLNYSDLQGLDELVDRFYALVGRVESKDVSFEVLTESFDGMQSMKSVFADGLAIAELSDLSRGAGVDLVMRMEEQLTLLEQRIKVGQDLAMLSSLKGRLSNSKLEPESAIRLSKWGIVERYESLNKVKNLNLSYQEMMDSRDEIKEMLKDYRFLYAQIMDTNDEFFIQLMENAIKELTEDIANLKKSAGIFLSEEDEAEGLGLMVEASSLLKKVLEGEKGGRAKGVLLSQMKGVQDRWALLFRRSGVKIMPGSAYSTFMKLRGDAMDAIVAGMSYTNLQNMLSFEDVQIRVQRVQEFSDLFWSITLAGRVDMNKEHVSVDLLVETLLKLQGIQKQWQTEFIVKGKKTKADFLVDLMDLRIQALEKRIENMLDQDEKIFQGMLNEVLWDYDNIIFQLLTFGQKLSGSLTKAQIRTELQGLQKQRALLLNSKSKLLGRVSVESDLIDFPSMRQKISKQLTVKFIDLLNQLEIMLAQGVSNKALAWEIFSAVKTMEMEIEALREFSLGDFLLGLFDGDQRPEAFGPDQAMVVKDVVLNDSEQLLKVFPGGKNPKIINDRIDLQLDKRRIIVLSSGVFSLIFISKLSDGMKQLHVVRDDELIAQHTFTSEIAIKDIQKVTIFSVLKNQANKDQAMLNADDVVKSLDILEQLTEKFWSISTRVQGGGKIKGWTVQNKKGVSQADLKKVLVEMQALQTQWVALFDKEGASKNIKDYTVAINDPIQSVTNRMTGVIGSVPTQQFSVADELASRELITDFQKAFWLVSDSAAADFNKKDISMALLFESLSLMKKRQRQWEVLYDKYQQPKIQRVFFDMMNAQVTSLQKRLRAFEKQGQTTFKAYMRGMNDSFKSMITTIQELRRSIKKSSVEEISSDLLTGMQKRRMSVLMRSESFLNDDNIINEVKAYIRKHYVKDMMSPFVSLSEELALKMASDDVDKKQLLMVIDAAVKQIKQGHLDLKEMARDKNVIPFYQQELNGAINDQAMISDQEDLINGGIDFNVNEMDLIEQGESFNFQFESMDALREPVGAVSGVLPVILNITPINSFVPLLGLVDDSHDMQISLLKGEG